MSRPDWDTYFLAIAETVAQRADCTRSKVGAVLVNARNEIRGTGYNGSPAGLPGCLSDGACPRGAHRRRTDIESYPYGGQTSTCACGGSWPCPDASEPDSDYSNCIADHAERNALRHSRPEDLKGATLYVTRPPCPGCTTLIEACGIVRVVSPPTFVEALVKVLECVHYMRPVFDGEGNLEGHRCIHTCGYFEPSTNPVGAINAIDELERVEECAHPWPAQTVVHTELTNRIRVKCMDCEDVEYVEIRR